MSNGRWNLNMLQDLFLPWEVEAIMTIPIARNVGEDKWAWNWTNHGGFTVKSAYYQAMEAKKTQATSTSKSVGGSIWKRLWHSSLPTKIKNFGWRVLHNGIAVKANLLYRGMGEDRRCPVCGEGDETIKHALTLCRDARSIWRLSPLRMEIQEMEDENVSQWCEKLAATIVQESWWEIFWNLLWGIWLRRNAWIFKRKQVSVKDLIDKAMRFTIEYQAAKESVKDGLRSEGPGKKKWHRPREGSLKLNTDAAVLAGGMIGFGGVVRDSMGEVRLACCGRMDGRFAPDIAEAMAIREVLAIAGAAGFREIILENDCLKLISQLKKHVLENSSFGNIVKDILDYVQAFNVVSFNHICRSGNTVAHNLA
ncbi:putative ribonuclease H protein At1g65750 [Beta vulgaris subsp. vulgaris]|uniref:putative ribonuclease H protein At1g65750 n=1 Tax=Beta vulgaris subsp. vulgaris TaxID=3555 RepID=UPI00053FC222|nr:putative ribonuclease H protein At1g65750 [Beta vulgaris subsp. vulgaris]